MTNRRIRAVLAALCTASILLAGCSSDVTDGSPAGSTPNRGSASTAPSAGASISQSGPGTPSRSAGGDASTAAASCTYVPGGDAARKVGLPPTHPVLYPTLTLSMNVNGTPAGSITISLREKSAPCTVGSIVHLARVKFYDATRCHRLTTSGIYVLQCGDPTATGTGGPGYAFPDELSGTEAYPAGTVAMANNGPDTNGSQFFLVYRASQLPPAYTVFGTITGGMQVLDSIASAGTASPAGDGTPKHPVVITTAVPS